MSKGFNPNPKTGTIYLSIQKQLKKMIEHHQNSQESIPIFKTNSKRFPILKQVVSS